MAAPMPRAAPVTSVVGKVPPGGGEHCIDLVEALAAGEGAHLGVSCSPVVERAGGKLAGGVVGDVFHKECPAREVLGHLAGRWAILVLTALPARPRRYHELRTVVAGISDKSLSTTLKSLQ